MVLIRFKSKDFIMSAHDLFAVYFILTMAGVLSLSVIGMIIKGLIQCYK